MNLGFLYKYGYDFASQHVHPMADDGHEDFYNITGLEPRPDFPDWRSVLSNTALVATIIVQEALNASRLSWRKEAFDAIGGARNFLLSGSPLEYLPMIKMSRIFQEKLPLSGPPESAPSPLSSE
jgi:hypothetical protein